MSALLSESGHFVYWCSDTQKQQNDLQYAFHDENVSRLLEKQLKSGFLKYAALQNLPLDIDGYLFSFNQTQEAFVFELLETLKQRTIIHPKLMINASTFGLHGTEKMQQILFRR